MKAHSIKLVQFIAAALFALPAIVCAAPPTSSSYYTDTVNSYVQDQVSKDMEELNSFLCMINAMGPDLMVNLGDYIAMVDLKACKPNTSQATTIGATEGNTNTGSNFMSVQLNSSRASNTDPMLTKIWMDNFAYSTPDPITGMLTNIKISVPMYVSASQAPNKYAPYGVFRLDYCKQYPTDTTCTKRIGYIDASKSGLAFYTLDYNIGQFGEYYNEFSLQLGANTTTSSGSGIVIKTNTNNANGTVDTSAIVFAHSPDYFYRDAGGNPQCFDRSASKAEESVWRYGLYTADKGERLTHQSGFPIQYDYSSNNTTNTGTVGTTYSGYIGYWGLYLPVSLPSGETVYKINYDTFPPTTKQYTLKQSGGKLARVSTIFSTLKSLDKTPFWFYPYAIVYQDGNPGATVAMNQYQYSEIYWDDSKQQFFIQRKYNSTTYQYDKFNPPLPINTASFVASDTYGWGVSAWTQGAYFTIPHTYFAQLATTGSNTRLVTQSNDNVYPADFAAINTAGGLKCIGSCPTASKIAAYNADLASAMPTNTVYPYLNYDTTSWGWGPFLNIANVTYSLNATTGEMWDGAPSSGSGNATGSPVVQTTANSIYSGRLVSASDMTYITTAKGSCGVTPCIGQGDVDLLANRLDSAGNPVNYSYYYWQTSSNTWDQMAYLLDGTTPVPFYAPLPVKFSIPNTTKYGINAGTNTFLQYGDFGDLYGIPNSCVDLRNNGDCVYQAATPTSGVTTGVYGACTSPTYDYGCSTAITPPDKQYWAAEFSIPFDPTIGVVTATQTQGSITQGTQYLVKALDKELRLSTVPKSICTVLGLDQPISVTKLPSSDQWKDPAANIGTKPVLNPVPAPRVIHGVKQY